MLFAIDSDVQILIRSVNGVHQQELESALLLLPVEYLIDFMDLLCDAIEQRKSLERMSFVLSAIQRLEMLSTSNKQL